VPLNLCSLFQNVRFHKISIPTYPPPQEELLEIPRGRPGVLKAKICNGKYEPKLTSKEIFVLWFFFCGGGFWPKKPSVWGLRIFSGTVQYVGSTGHTSFVIEYELCKSLLKYRLHFSFFTLKNFLKLSNFDLTLSSPRGKEQIIVLDQIRSFLVKKHSFKFKDVRGGLAGFKNRV